MHVLVKKQWIDTPLDYALCEDEIRINVQLFVNIARIENVYFQRQKDWRLVWNYVREIGIANTLNKIVSRSAESRRNEKYLSAGYGYFDNENGYRQHVFFIAPLHPSCLDLIACHKNLIFFTNEILDIPPRQILHVSADRNPHRTELLEISGETCGWSVYAGIENLAIAWEKIIPLLKKITALPELNTLTTKPRTPITLSHQKQPNSSNINGTLFGYGNYAKTVILPNLPPKIKISRIHEIDPLQFSDKTYLNYQCSTEPKLCSNDQNRVLFIAGYHHTHAGIATEGLRRNLDTVVEKPLVTSREQLALLQSAYEKSTGRFFACFHKRYLGFNERVRNDFQIGPDEPINYHAIVYEVPLPKLHWYRWPNSCSRIVSNGCHWIDHFLFLNNFSAVANYSANSAPDGTINVSVTLENDAYFTMVLTDKGSERLGVQDYIELRQNQTTIKITNGAHYQAEDSRRILVRSSSNRMESYRNMYRSIGNRIANTEVGDGDSWQSIFISSKLALDIEALLSDTMSATLPPLKHQLTQKN